MNVGEILIKKSQILWPPRYIVSFFAAPKQLYYLIVKTIIILFKNFKIN